MSSLWLDMLGGEARYRGKTYRTRTLEYGTGTPLFLLHGIGGHAEAYARNLRGLGAAQHAIALDFLWHGLSEKPQFSADMIGTYCRQLIDVLDDLGAERASIEGESLGSWVAMAFALRYPDRVEKIILNTAAGVAYDADKVKIDHASGREQLRARSLAAIANPNRETVRKRLEWLMAAPDRVTDELVDVRFAMYSDPATQAALTSVFEHTFSPEESAAERIPEAALANIVCPTLVLWSDKNPGEGPEVGRRLQSLIPGAEFACIIDGAHWPQWEQPAQHDAIVNAFLAGRTVTAVSV